MPARPGQLALPFKPTHGGRRKGAGRPNRSGLRAHVRRPALSKREPVHVTLGLAPGLPSLRKKEIFRCLRAAVRIARMKGLSVAHFSILSNHIHFILEPSEASLARTMQSLCVSFAKRLNRLSGRAGPVFEDRYHLHVLRTPSEVRNALEYVLTNEGRHRSRNRGRIEVRLDPFSSALSFREWKRLCGARARFEPTFWPEAVIENWFDEILSPARTWLLKEGWKKASA